MSGKAICQCHIYINYTTKILPGQIHYFIHTVTLTFDLQFYNCLFLSKLEIQYFVGRWNNENKIVKVLHSNTCLYRSLNRHHWWRWQWNGIICDMMGAVCGAGYAYPFGAPDFTSGFHRGSCFPVTCVSLFHVIVLSFGFWLLFDCMVSLYFVVIWDWIWKKEGCKLVTVVLFQWSVSLKIYKRWLIVTDAVDNIFS